MAQFNADTFLEEDLTLVRLRQLRKDDLIAVGRKMSLDLSGLKTKAELFSAIAARAELMPESVSGDSDDCDDRTKLDSDGVRLALAQIELEERRDRLRAAEHEREMERKRLEFEMMRHSEMVSQSGQLGEREKRSMEAGFSARVKLIPQYDETDLDSFFLLFERVARKMEWPESDWALLIQQVISGKAQSVVSALSYDHAFDYWKMKDAILQAFELVPEAYRQMFRDLKRDPAETCVEFARRKEVAFDRWIRSLRIEMTYESLREVVLIDEFTRCMSRDVKTYMNDHAVVSVRNAAMLADGYELSHRSSASQLQPPSPLASGFGWSRSETLHKDVERSKSPKSKLSGGSQSNGFRPEGRLFCAYCKKDGHLISHCQKLKDKNTGQNKVQASGFVRPATVCVGDPVCVDGVKHKFHDGVDEGYKEFISDGTVKFTVDGEEFPVVILRDTGSVQTLLIADESSLESCFTGMRTLIQDVNEGFKSVPLYDVELCSGLVSGRVTVGIVSRLPMKGITMLLGNDLAGGKVQPSTVLSDVPVVDSKTEALKTAIPGIFPSCAVTRAQAMAGRDEREVEHGGDIDLGDTVFRDLSESMNSQSGDDRTIFSQPALIAAQQSAADLKGLYRVALTAGEAEKVSQCYYIKSGVLMRKWCPPGRPADEDWVAVDQVVVPPQYRAEILRLAHDIPLAGHLGVRKTVARIRAHFYWPGLRKCVSEYCKSCHVCQVVGKPQHHIKPAPLIPIPVFPEPFSRVLIDCVGPLPKTKAGYQYLLTVMDSTTRFPEAFPLRNIKAKTVIDALLVFFTRYGLPQDIQSDRGSNFTSSVFQEVMHQLGIKQVNSSPYHPQSQGALERYHQTLKTMIKSYCSENTGDWEKGIPFLLFASRDTPNESTGFTPFELVFGHEPRGPLKVVKEHMLSESEVESGNVLDYVSQFRERLLRACELAGEHLRSSQRVMMARADKKAEPRSFEPGSKVLVLLPIQGEPLRAKFSGPYVVEKNLGKETYLVSTPDRRKTKRVCHINMLKKYYDRDEVATVAVVCEKAAEHIPGELEIPVEAEIGEGMSGKVNNSHVMANPSKILGHLSDFEQQDVVQILLDYPEVCGDKLGYTGEAIHDVDVGDHLPIKQHPYRLNPRKKSQVRKELEYMLACGVIEPSQSCWSSPVVLVPKPDGSQRFCIDYRKVNAVTKPDSFPLPRIEDCIDQIGNARYITKLDLMKGYWQVPLTERAREISAFVTPQGLFQCRVMPFGMRNAPATFQRLMNCVIAGLDNVVVYLDDILVVSDTWSDHLTCLRDVFVRLTKAGLVVNLSKCEFAQATVTYLGHVVGHGCVAPREAKVQAIVDFPAPSTKKEVMRFLGMCGFYRKFVPNFSDIVVPLTDLLKKGTKFDWTKPCEIAFQKLKAVLISKPVLQAPNFEHPFLLATDASEVGVGAVLLQLDEEGFMKPVSYFSKKLDVHQQRYSTVEKECLGLVLAVQHFDVYLSSCPDVTVFTDHNPLTFLERFRNKNQRLFRWSLFLQPYGLNVTHIKGNDNVIADTLSRV
ncbi:uncharacterized protein LOC121412478 [Lytechinus variegatus]|uniref:uncharacterized protein LOC121412478 n=1 Tax=Lytechinus variegatus TaxID=7654 RepID=UPI001BB21C30|nr:uncharacterized protein LOC121412478 [Lytechinus variegatus]